MTSDGDESFINWEGRPGSGHRLNLKGKNTGDAHTLKAGYALSLSPYIGEKTNSEPGFKKPHCICILSAHSCPL